MADVGAAAADERRAKSEAVPEPEPARVCECLLGGALDTAAALAAAALTRILELPIGCPSLVSRLSSLPVSVDCLRHLTIWRCCRCFALVVRLLASLYPLARPRRIPPLPLLPPLHVCARHSLQPQQRTQQPPRPRQPQADSRSTPVATSPRPWPIDPPHHNTINTTHPHTTPPLLHCRPYLPARLTVRHCTVSVLLPPPPATPPSTPSPRPP